jgi:hypothetical protein
VPQSFRIGSAGIHVETSKFAFAFSSSFSFSKQCILLFFFEKKKNKLRVFISKIVV